MSEPKKNKQPEFVLEDNKQGRELVIPGSLIFTFFEHILKKRFYKEPESSSND